MIMFVHTYCTYVCTYFICMYISYVQQLRILAIKIVSYVATLYLYQLATYENITYQFYKVLAVYIASYIATQLENQRLFQLKYNVCMYVRMYICLAMQLICVHLYIMAVISKQSLKDIHTMVETGSGHLGYFGSTGSHFVQVKWT